MFNAETSTFGFQNVFAHADNQCWALPQTSPQIHKLRTQRLGLRICEPISYRKDLRICGKKLKSTAYQHHWHRFCNFQKKKTFSRLNVSTELGGCIYKVQTPYHQVPLLWNDYFPEVLLFLQQNDLTYGQETSNGLFL